MAKVPEEFIMDIKIGKVQNMDRDPLSGLGPWTPSMDEG